MAVWLRENAGDNRQQLDRLRRNLRRAMREELTDRQRQMVAMYFADGLNMTQIARALGVGVPTVSRTLRRAKARLRRLLQYGL